MQVDTARADVAEAIANHASAQVGPTKAERAIADARVTAAAAEVAVLEGRLHKTVLTASADGIVRVVAGEVGEAIRAGQPLSRSKRTPSRGSLSTCGRIVLGGSVGAVNVLASGASAPFPRR